MGSFQSTVLSNIWFAVLGTTGVILAAIYMLWMVQRVFFGEVSNDENKELTDLNTREVGLLLPVMILIVWIGVYPTLFTGYSESHIHHTLERSKAKGEHVAAAARTQTNPAWVATLYGLNDDLASK